MNGAKSVNRFGERDHLADVTPVGPVADDLVCAFDRQVEDGRAVHGYSERVEFLRGQPRHSKRRALGFFRVASKQSRIGGGGRKIARHWRLQALHPSAFLIDQDEEIRLADRFANAGNEPLQLIGPRDVAAKEDQPRRLDLTEKASFFIR